MNKYSPKVGLKKKMKTVNELTARSGFDAKWVCQELRKVNQFLEFEDFWIVEKGFGPWVYCPLGGNTIRSNIPKEILSLLQSTHRSIPRYLQRGHLSCSPLPVLQFGGNVWLWGATEKTLTSFRAPWCWHFREAGHTQGPLPISDS